MGPLESKIGTMERQLSRWGAKLDELYARAEEKSVEARVEYRLAIDDLLVKHELAQARLAELQVAGGDKWDIMKEGVESAWSDLEIAFESLKA